MKSLGLTLLIFTYSCLSYEERCPYNLEWKLRARAFCGGSQLYYSCVFDAFHQIYVESCSEPPDLVAPGYKFIVVGHQDMTLCSDDMYQPFSLWSNVTSDCVFKKSTFNEFGQILFNNGSNKEDRKVRCDYSKGYAFVNLPINHCYCTPSEEDCSCYEKTCGINTKLSADYNCVEEDSGWICPPIVERTQKNEDTEIVYRPDLQEAQCNDISDFRKKNRENRNLILTWVLSGLIVFCTQIVVTFLDYNELFSEYEIIKKSVHTSGKFRKDIREDHGMRSMLLLDATEIRRPYWLSHRPTPKWNQARFAAKREDDQSRVILGLTETDMFEDFLSDAATKQAILHLKNAIPIKIVTGFKTMLRKNDELERKSDQNQLSICGPIKHVNVKRQRSNSICKAYGTGFDFKHVEKEWFYKVKILCDHKYELHLIIDRRLQTKYETLKSERKQREYIIAEEECQATNSMEEFEMIYMQMQKPQFKLEDCIKSERSLLLRFILARFTPSFHIVENLKIAMNNQLFSISAAICWYIVRHYVAQSQVKNLLGMVVDIWPGYYCKCLDKGRASICSSEPVIVVETDHQLEALSEEYLGIQVLQCVSFRESQLMAAHASAETEHISKITRLSEKVHTLPCDIVENLFLKHSKLTMTYISSENPEYVQLCCQVKGIIPIGEDHFPEEVNHLKTNVNEGHVMFLQKLFVGQKIGTEPTVASFGTLGGFVEFRGKPALLTCAHVVYDRETLLGGSKRNKHKTEVETFCRLENDTSVACGYVIHDAFEYDNREKTSVDAAVIRLNRDVLVDSGEICKDNTSTTKPMSHLGMTSPFLNDNYISHHRNLKGTVMARSVGGSTGYSEGLITYEDYDDDEETFRKFKLEHGVVPQWENFETQIEKIKAENPKPLYTTSDLHFQKAIIPALGKAIQHKRYFVRFYKQLLLDNFKFEPGDSGACIYVVEDKTTVRADLSANPTGCIGMAIASYVDVRDEKTKCIVTPMKAILEELGLI